MSSLVVKIKWLSLIVIVLCMSITDGSSNPFLKGKSPVTNIAHGDFAKPGEFKYQVALLAIVRRIYFYQFCGGSLISARHVLSAAHCVQQMSVPNVILRAGVNDYADGRNAQDRRVSSWITHPQHDIVLINVQEPFTVTAFVQPIPLVTKFPSRGTECVVSGWGRHGTVKQENTSLLKKAVNRIGLQRGEKYLIYATEETLTTGWTCSGDSGGPLACNGELAGVVQWMLAEKDKVKDPSYCPKSLRGYGNVLYYVPWLKKNGFQN